MLLKYKRRHDKIKVIRFTLLHIKLEIIFLKGEFMKENFSKSRTKLTTIALASALVSAMAFANTPVFADTPVIDPVAEAPTDTPVIDPVTEPTPDTPVVDTPVTPTPEPETPVIDTPVIDPVTEVPVTDPVTEQPITDPVTEAPTTDPSTDTPSVDPAPETPSTDGETEKPVTAPTEGSQAGNVSPSTGQTVSNVSLETPIKTQTGHEIVGTDANSGSVTVRNADGSLAVVSASAVNATINEDKTISVTDEKGEAKTLPETPAKDNLWLTIIGSLLMLLGVKFIGKRDNVVELSKLSY